MQPPKPAVSPMQSGLQAAATPRSTGASREVVVVKIGGAAVDLPAAAANLMRQVGGCQAEGVRLVLVHGGGQRLTAMAKRLGVPAEFAFGRRVTGDALIDVAKLVFAGGVGTDLAAAAWALGVRAVPVSGVAAGLVQATRRPPQAGVDYGWVGDIASIDPSVLTTLMDGGFVPLVASLGVDAQGLVYNINADTIATAIAVALKATRLIVLSELDGVLRDPADAASRIPVLDVASVRAGTSGVELSGGMLPKLASLMQAVEAGVGSVHIASWNRPDVLSACLGDGSTDVGTRLV